MSCAPTCKLPAGHPGHCRTSTKHQCIRCGKGLFRAGEYCGAPECKRISHARAMARRAGTPQVMESTVWASGTVTQLLSCGHTRTGSSGPCESCPLMWPGLGFVSLEAPVVGPVSLTGWDFT